MRSSFSMPLLYHAYVYLEFLILACTIYILALIPLVAARCVLLESAAESAPQGGIFRCSAFVFADKNSIVIIGTLIKRAVCDTLLYELIVNTTPEKILYHSVTILIFWRQEQGFRFIFLGSRGWLPVRHRLSRENFHGFHKVIFLDLDEIIEGRIADETSRPPIPFAVGNLQAVVFCGTVHIACAFDLNKIARLKLPQIG